jgi:hypothetical protein
MHWLCVARDRTGSTSAATKWQRRPAARISAAGEEDPETELEGQKAVGRSGACDEGGGRATHGAPRLVDNLGHAGDARRARP